MSGFKTGVYSTTRPAFLRVELLMVKLAGSDRLPPLTLRLAFFRQTINIKHFELFDQDEGAAALPLHYG